MLEISSRSVSSVHTQNALKSAIRFVKLGFSQNVGRFVMLRILLALYLVPLVPRIIIKLDKVYPQTLKGISKMKKCWRSVVGQFLVCTTKLSEIVDINSKWSQNTLKSAI